MGFEPEAICEKGPVRIFCQAIQIYYNYLKNKNKKNLEAGNQTILSPHLYSLNRIYELLICI